MRTSTQKKWKRRLESSCTDVILSYVDPVGVPPTYRCRWLSISVYVSANYLGQVRSQSASHLFDWIAQGVSSCYWPRAYLFVVLNVCRCLFFLPISENVTRLYLLSRARFSIFLLLNNKEKSHLHSERFCHCCKLEFFFSIRLCHFMANLWYFKSSSLYKQARSKLHGSVTVLARVVFYACLIVCLSQVNFSRHCRPKPPALLRLSSSLPAAYTSVCETRH